MKTTVVVGAANSTLLDDWGTCPVRVGVLAAEMLENVAEIPEIVGRLEAALADGIVGLATEEMLEVIAELNSVDNSVGAGKLLSETKEEPGTDVTRVTEV